MFGSHSDIDGMPSSKGQVVIPKLLRDSLHLLPGDELLIIEDGNSLRLLPASAAKAGKSTQRSALSAVAGVLQRPGRGRLDEAAMRSAVRKRAAERNRP